MGRKLLSKPQAPALLAALALLASTVAAVVYTHRLQSLTAAIVADNVTGLRAAEELEFALRDMRSTLYQYALSGDEVLLAALPGLERDFRRSLEAARLSAVTAEEQEYFRQIAIGYQEYTDTIEQFNREPSTAARQETARALADSFTHQLVPLCHAFLEHNEQAIEDSAQTHARITTQLQYVLILAGFLVPVGGMLLGYLASRGVNQELARSREQLLRAEQLAAVGRLAAGMAHELRNPLTSIMMMVQTASQEDPADLGVIEDEVRRMERTIQACLDFAKPPKPHHTVFDVRDAADDACRLVQGRLRRHQTELVVEHAPDPLLISADRHQLHQVFVNLLLNAVESTGPRGRIGLVSEQRQGAVLVHVWDQGPGIPEELLPTIFDPFVSSKETGTGLGLSNSKQIIENHGGRIEVRNRPEGGAEFTVRLQGTHSHAHAPGDRRRAEHSAVLPQSVSAG